MVRQPTPGGDGGTWGPVLNEYLSVAHEADGSLKQDAVSALPASPLWYPLYRSGFYYFCNSPASASTSSGLGNGSLRLTPWVVTKSVTITRIGAEFSVAGEANSVFRLGIYADDGTGIPGGAAVLDAGSISTGTGNAGTVATGGTPGVYEITVSQALTPGLYWVGGAVQGAPSTQPTIRTVANSLMIQPIPSATLFAANSGNVGFVLASVVTGALPTWSGTASAGSAPRVFFKVT